MSDNPQVLRTTGAPPTAENAPSEPCVMLLFGASGDLSKRLLVPALYNLACDGLLSERFALLGTAMDPLTTESFRERMSADVQKFHTRPQFDAAVWEGLVRRFHYRQGAFGDPRTFDALKADVEKLGEEFKTGGNILFYFATAPRFFGSLCASLHTAGFKEGPGWRRIVVEKPFGTDLSSALALNKEVLADWQENQIYRVDHYLGKETVQNLLAFRFSNGMFEPLWNKNYIDNIQFNVSEAVDVEGRGAYYDSAGVLRDMMQNHMFQMLAYLCMEVPGSFEPDALRNEKAKLLQSVRRYDPNEVARFTVRGQYGPSIDRKTKQVLRPGYREEQGVDRGSRTETYAAVRLHIDNWRWEGVPIYLRSGKALWKRGTEIVVEFKKAPEVLFRGTPVQALGANRLIFHIQPYQGIEVQFQAKIPGPTLRLQPVKMRFSYGDVFSASRYTGYEVMLYSCSHGDATLFSRGDLVEAAWRVAQPILDRWAEAPPDFPNYARGSWGPTAAADLLTKDGRRWYEVVTAEVLERVPLFRGGGLLFLEQVILALRSMQVSVGELVIKKGEVGRELYLLERGEVEVLDDTGKVINVLSDGDIFGEIGVLMSMPRTANVRAISSCDLLVLDKADFSRILRDNPQIAQAIQRVAKERYSISVHTDTLLAPH
jgi:glucose-6-phosphate 1-dehydrogenase